MKPWGLLAKIYWIPAWPSAFRSKYGVEPLRSLWTWVAGAMIHHTRTFYAYFAFVFGAICRQSCIRVPSMLKDFFKTMVHWSRRYLSIFGIFVDALNLMEKRWHQNACNRTMLLMNCWFPKKILESTRRWQPATGTKVDALRPQLEPFLLPYKDGAWSFRLWNCSSSMEGWASMLNPDFVQVQVTPKGS